MKRLLIVENDRKRLAVVSSLLNGLYTLDTCSTVSEATDLAMAATPDILILSLGICKPGGGYDLRGVADSICPGVPLVCLAEPETARQFAESMGMVQLLVGNQIEQSLLSSVRYASATMTEARMPASPQRVMRAPDWTCEGSTAIVNGSKYAGIGTGRRTYAMRHTLAVPDQLLGGSPGLHEVRHKIRLFARCEAPVLILGESGTGKELAAQAIHRLSARSHASFLPVNCATLPEAIAESTLFGSVRGAFTDAVDAPGIFETVSGGTLFLDEIGELPSFVQAKLLRTLETGSGTRVGSTRQITYDARIISATNADILSGTTTFRKDLRYRLDTLTLKMPPLRDHKDDIPLLVRAFLDRKFPEKNVSQAAMDILTAWDWPGNVRELRNTVIRAAVMSGESPVIHAADIEILTQL